MQSILVRGTESASRRDALRYLIFGRAVPATYFGVLAVLNLRLLASDVRNLGPHATLEQIAFGPVHAGLYLCFVSIPVVIYIGRPRPRARDGSILAGVTAFTGTFMLTLLPILTKRGPSLVALPEWLQVVAHLLLLASVTLAVWSIVCLRMNFSITPEARRLERRGPYRFVRHPVYVAEIGAASTRYSVLMRRSGPLRSLQRSLVCRSADRCSRSDC